MIDVKPAAVERCVLCFKQSTQHLATAAGKAVCVVLSAGGSSQGVGWLPPAWLDLYVSEVGTPLSMTSLHSGEHANSVVRRGVVLLYSEELEQVVRGAPATAWRSLQCAKF